MRKIKMNHWNKPIGMLATVALAAAGINFPFSAGAQSPRSSQVAQSSTPKSTLVGQCRAAKQATAIFQDAAATSPVVVALKLGDKVTLAADTAQEGFIAVSAPSKGFVQTVNLKSCAGAPAPKPTDKPADKPVSDKPTTDKGMCRFVSQAQGLVIRKEPTTASEAVGEAKTNTQITLTTSPATAKTDTEGRVWVEISAPTKGWVSNGFAQGGSNLVYCK